MSAPAPSSGAGSSYAGFEYQFLATAWLAMRLIWADRLCDGISVEPASHEDVAVALKNPAPSDEISTHVGLSASTTQLDIQIKRRALGWTKSSFRDVLTDDDAPAGSRGPKPRVRPLESLTANTDRRYLLLTNAQVSADLTDFVVGSFHEPSAATTLPVEPAVAAASTIAPRISIIPEHHTAQLTLELEKSVRLHGHVPDVNVGDCVRQLIDEVRLRVLGEAPSLWRKNDIERVILANGGALDLLRAIVLPIVFPKMEERLQKNHRLLLTGGPGVGKTELAHELAERLHRSPDAFKIVTSEAGVQGIREALSAPGRNLFFIEDPWGHDRLSSEAAAWANELPKLFNKAGPTKRFLVTSRVGVRHEAFGTKPIPGFTDAEFVLKPEHYSDDQRREIMRIQMLAAQPWQRDWEKRHDVKWMEELHVPLAITHFAARVIQATSETELKIDEVIRASNVDALSANFALEIRERGQPMIAGALLLWALHHADAHVTPESARAGKTTARAGKYLEPLDPEKTLEILVGAGWLRPAKSGFVAHPTALTGIESLLLSEPGKADEVIGALLLGLVDKGETARAFTIVQWLQQRPSAVGDTVRAKIEEHLFQVFMTAKGYDARRAFTQLTEHAVSENAVIRLMRALKPARGKGPLSGLEFWRPPKLAADQIAEITASGEARDVARKFVAEVLPNDTWYLYSASDLIPFLQQFDWNFEPELSASAIEALTNYDRNARLDFLVEAALLSGATNFDQLTDAVLTAGDTATRLWDANAEDRRRGQQAEIDADYASHLEEEGSELFSPVERARDLIVAARRTAKGWAWLDSHPRRTDMVWSWAKSIDRGATSAEFTALAAACTDSRLPLWTALAGSTDATQLPVLLAEASNATVEDVRDWAKHTATLTTNAEWNALAIPVISGLRLACRMSLATMNVKGEDHADRLALLASVLSEAERSVRDICDVAARLESWSQPVTEFQRSALRELAVEGTEYFKRAATIALAKLNENVGELLLSLRSSKEYKDRQTALVALRQTGADVTVAALDALNDPDYRVRRRALHLLADVPTASTWPAILARADDPSAPVRATCAQIIGHNKAIVGVPILLRLLNDRRDRRASSLTHDSWPDHHVAKEAAEALCQFNLDPASVTACLSFLEGRGSPTDNRDDVEVDHHVLLALSDADDDRLIPFLSKLLGSHWHVSGQRNSGYPLRFTAAWCLASQLAAFPARTHLVDLSLVATAAMHNDSRLAGPALIALAFSGPGATPQIVEVARAVITTPDRAILLEACLPEDRTTARAALQEKSGVAHPARSLLDLDAADFPSLEKWARWLAKYQVFKRWLKGIQSKEDINPLLRYALSLHFSGAAPPELASDDKLDGLLPKPIGTITLRSMIGGE